MVKKEKRPYGYIYIATNRQNGKKYIGQTVTGKNKEGKIPIEERWKKEIREAYRKERNGERLRYIERAIIKYGPENFDLKQEDIAQDQKELDEKETKNIKDYDSMNREKGYNQNPGGRGGRPSPEVMEYLSKRGKEKWNEDLEYRDKQTKERRERAKDPGWLEKMTEINREKGKNPEFKEKMTEINRERAKTPEYQEKMSEALTNKWQDKEYQENVSKGVSDKWQDKEYQEKQSRAKSEGKKEIPDNREFLQDIREMKKKDINAKYDMDGKSINKRIKEKLGHRGVNNYSEGKDFLKDKNLDDIAKEINKRDNENIKNSGVKKEINDIREFLSDVKDNKKKKELMPKYDLGEHSYNRRIKEMFPHDGPKNHTELNKYLQDKSIDEVLKELEEKSIDKQDRSQSTENSADESPPESNRGLPEKEDMEESKTKDEQSDNIDGDSEKKSTNEPSAAISDIPNAMNDYEGINEFSHDEEGDIGGINENINNDNRDFAGINDISDDHLKDFEGINDHSEGLKENVKDGDTPSKDDKERDIKEIEPSPATKEAKEELKTDFAPDKEKGDFEYV